MSAAKPNPTPHLAELNVARLRAPVDAPEVAEFVNALARVNAVAERSPGFVWRYTDDGASGGAIDAPPNPDDPQLIINYSIWSSIADLERFVWKTIHARFFDRRAEWFETIDAPNLVMWFVAPDARPPLETALARLEDLRVNGPSPRAFGWAELVGAQLWRERRG